jgi:indolepyruvate ferredoxin oxidoreductase
VTSVLTRPGGEFSLEDRYRRLDGDIYLTGVQALVRTLLDRARRDRARRDGVAGRDTATYVSGYEGSPLAGYDLELARNQDLLRELDIIHQPALNEELAATAVSGTQLARALGEARTPGVTGVWYGKAPGLDRAGDALRHANMIGSDPLGGAVALVGDDPAAKSSSVPCSSEFALADLAMPAFAPSDPAEILDYGLHAVELSRASGLWSALKVATVVADGACTARIAASWSPPDLGDLPSGLRAYGHRPSARLLGAELAELERSFHESRLPVAVEYIRRSGVNRVSGAVSGTGAVGGTGGGPGGRIGIVAAGATYLAVRQALDVLGLDDAGLERAGLRVLKLGVVFPVEPSIVRSFAQGLDSILVVENKRAFLEDAVKAVLYGTQHAPAVYGKRGPDGAPLFGATGEHDADSAAGPLWRFLTSAGLDELRAPAAPRRQLTLSAKPRAPFFCSGCPHNFSTRVPEGTLVGAGIGCHAMLLLMPGERSGDITGLCQMGGEGGHWIGMAPFAGRRHFTQNIGDGTFAHSGSLAVRAAVDAGVNMTFKLLRNSAVAMTGGQRPVGEMTLSQVIGLLEAEGVRRIVVTTDEPRRVRREIGRAAQVRHRDDLLDVQRELAALDGVTVLIHDQECAAEKRRKRRRGKVAPPTQRVFINERVCEGCGDCGAKSNCLSVHPVETTFGRKTRINQSSCNVDFSCLAGDCPSFLTVEPGRRTRRARQAPRLAPQEAPPSRDPEKIVPRDRFTMRITGIGGTGVVTVSQVLATAAAIEGRHVRALDQTGLAQKGGAVVSDLVLTTAPLGRSPKLAAGECDLYLGCDALVATEPKNLRAADVRRTVAVLSGSQVPTGEMVVDPAARYPSRESIGAVLAQAVRESHVLDAAAIAVERLGDEQYANMVLVGAAYQAGALPLDAAAIERAIELNGTAVDANVAAFRWGRHEVTAGPPPASAPRPAIGQLREELTAYQDAAYAERFAGRVDRVRARESEVVESRELTEAVARNLFKLMAYKDEYEVARLSLDPGLEAELTAQFGPGAKARYQLHPPILRALGMRRKISLGAWFRVVFRVLVSLRRLRGTPFDPFGRARVRKVERALIDEYLGTVDELLAGLTDGNHALAVEIAELPDLVRGYEDVKLASVETYRQRTADALRRLREQSELRELSTGTPRPLEQTRS